MKTLLKATCPQCNHSFPSDNSWVNCPQCQFEFANWEEESSEEIEIPTYPRRPLAAPIIFSLVLMACEIIMLALVVNSFGIIPQVVMGIILLILVTPPAAFWIFRE